MRVLIMEDEATLSSALADTLVKLRPDIEIVGISDTVRDSMELIGRHPDLDVIFEDIRLADGYCFDVFDNVTTEAMIVFTTAYDEYVLKAFDYDCIDYLMKPYGRHDFEDALRKAEKRILRTRLAEARAVSGTLFSGGSQYRRKMEILRHDSIMLVDTGEICYMHYDFGRVRVYCADGQSGIVDMSLTKLIQELDPELFTRVSRQYIVNIACVRRIKPTLGRNKILGLKAPYDSVGIEVSNETAKSLRAMWEKAWDRRPL